MLTVLASAPKGVAAHSKKGVEEGNGTVPGQPAVPVPRIHASDRYENEVITRQTMTRPHCYL